LWLSITAQVQVRTTQRTFQCYGPFADLKQTPAQAYYSGSPYKTLAEQYGFIVIYPSSPHSGTCWDVSSKATLTHNGGGDSNSIANMATWTIAKYSADASKVFVTGSSSGAMMTVSIKISFSPYMLLMVMD
jgi:poly(3-hydroxybutyrate) depolymerase